MIIKEQTKNQCLNRIAALDALEEENRNTGKTKTRHFPRSIQKVYLQKKELILNKHRKTFSVHDFLFTFRKFS